MSRPLSLLLILLLSTTNLTLARANVAGTMFSGTTAADPAAVYWNPAAMTQLQGTQLMIAGTISPLRLHYQRDTPSANDGLPFAQANVMVLAPKATLGLVTDATLRRWRFGLGLAFPMVDGASWETTYGGRPSSTRYYATQGRQVMWIISAAAAYRVTSWLSLGLGVDMVGMWLVSQVMTDWGAKIDQIACAALGGFACRLDAPLAREDPQYDGKTRVDGVGLGAGVSAGVLATPWPWLRLGIGVHSGGGDVKVPVSISAEVPPAAVRYLSDNFPSIQLPIVAATGDVMVNTPVIVTAGVAVTAVPRLELTADLHWMNTSTTSIMLASITRTSTALVGDQVLVSRKEDCFLAALRGSYRVLDPLLVGLRLEFDANARPDQFVTPVSLDFHKLSLHLGVNWRATRWLTLEAEYAHFFIFSRTITRSQFQPNAFPTTPEEEGLDKPGPTGRYSAEADLFGVGATLSF